ALFGAVLVFTIRAGSGAAFDQGEPNAVPPEIFIYAQGSPGLNVILDNIERVAEESGNGKDLKIIIDNSVNIWPWPWYMREYRNVEYSGFDEDFVPAAGGVVLVSDSNQAVMQPLLDQYHEPIPYTHMWWFPELYKGLEMGDFFQDVFDGDLFHRWRIYMASRSVERATASPNMLAFFPIEYGNITVPPPVPGEAGPSEQLPADSVTVLGTAGAAIGEFSQPGGLAVDAQGNLYVVDTLQHRVQRLAPDGTWSAFGEQGSDPGQFGNPRTEEYAVDDGPWGVGVDADGFIYVADTWNHRIQKFSPELELVADWGIGGMFGPRDVAVTADGNLLISDTGNNRLMLYDTDGQLVRTFGAAGDGRGEFSEPTGIAIAPNGDIYVADFWNKRIQHFDANLQEIGVIEVDSWGSPGITDRAYIAALADGRVLATDPANHRIVVFSAAGEEEAAWSLPGVSSRPVGIAVNAAGEQVYISDGAISQVVRVPLAALLAPQETSQPTP
ncbi:MAG: NHL repeat-containing protein, partial [Dehalococcoidia bacterium]